MKENLVELSPRYYPAELTSWILGAILFLYVFPGLQFDQFIPFINIKIQNTNYLPHIISAILFSVLIYLFLEYKQSASRAKDNILTRCRITATTLWAGTALWTIMPTLVKNTIYEGISPAWYLVFLGIGYLIGFFTQLISFATLMIRDPIEAERLNLSRVPNATRAQYIVLGPVLLLLLITYFVLISFAPASINSIAALLTDSAFLYIILQEASLLFMSRDRDGNKFSYKEIIKRFKDIHDCHDRSYFLIEHGEKTIKNFGINSSQEAKLIQDRIRDKLSVNNKQPTNFRIKLLEEIKIELYPKDTDYNNTSSGNWAYKIRKSDTNNNTLRVLYEQETPEKREIELTILINAIEDYAEIYLASEPNTIKPDHLKILQKAINQVVFKEALKKNEPPIVRAAMGGDLEYIKELIKLKEDVNTSGEGGWTALLASSAQGYPEIMKELLKAGANPDISNVLGITPLMYGTRYGNIEVIDLLIDYGANINLQDRNGDTALMKAVEFGNIDILDTLIKVGAKLPLKNIYGKDALQLAYEFGHGEIAKKLRKVDSNNSNHSV